MLYVGNLPVKMEKNELEKELENVFGACGVMVSIQLIIDRETGRSRGYAFVNVLDDVLDGGEYLIQTLNSYEIGGNTIVAQEAVPKK